ncbi:hypothetical protein AVEN_4325-1 [Araneus ventricosus]|uniref:Uncharacterized protein n=1 Tax=Araneus ventricosus TaxID=182803 RepID=A0A4Y2FAR4_ARAVE|nr:hypothetical protein AVEN_4325-1 [Araneus ventricosus]
MLRLLISNTSPIWATAAKTHRKELEMLQNKTARRKVGMRCFLRSRDIQKDIQLTSVKHYHRRLIECGHSLHGFLERETEKPIKSEETIQTDRHVWNSVWTEIRECGERKFCAEGIQKGKSPP